MVGDRTSWTLADLKAAFEAIDQNAVRCVVLTGPHILRLVYRLFPLIARVSFSMVQPLRNKVRFTGNALRPFPPRPR